MWAAECCGFCSVRKGTNMCFAYTARRDEMRWDGGEKKTFATRQLYEFSFFSYCLWLNLNRISFDECLIRANPHQKDFNMCIKMTRAHGWWQTEWKFGLWWWWRRIKVFDWIKLKKRARGSESRNVRNFSSFSFHFSLRGHKTGGGGERKRKTLSDLFCVCGEKFNDQSDNENSVKYF